MIFRISPNLSSLLIGCMLVLAISFATPSRAEAEQDHTEIVGPNACGECHKKTVAVWQKSHHFSTFKELPRRKEAIEIAKKMGLKRIKAGSLCLDCHFTTAEASGGKRKAIAGVSCESCHGPAKGYVKRHGEFSGKKKESETEAEALQRWADSDAAGMIRPGDMYALAKNCYDCHTVPQEKLVNTGGHTAGSKFELVSWSQGEVRHNVWYNGGKGNAEASAEHKRVMFVVGLAVELETSIRAVGNATVKADYAVAMAKRAGRAKARFRKIADVLPIPEIGQINLAANSVKLKLNNKDKLSKAAAKIAEAANAISDNYDGSTFGAVDGMIPPASKYKGMADQ